MRRIPSLINTWENPAELCLNNPMFFVNRKQKKIDLKTKFGTRSAVNYNDSTNAFHMGY